MTQINIAAPSAPRLARDQGLEKMFNSNELRDELQSLKSDASRLFDSGTDGIFDNSKARAEALAEQIKAALNELGETLGEQEEQVEHFTSDRPITTLASAFALGVVVGFMLRRH